MDRRAQEQTGNFVWELISIVLVLVVVASALILVVRVVGSGSENEDRGTQFGFFSLAAVIRDYVNDPAAFLPVKAPFTHALYLDDDFILVGFNKGDRAAKPLDGCWDWNILGGARLEYVTRPTECGELACLCLYPQTAGTNDFDADSTGDGRNKPNSCVAFPGVDYLMGFWYYDALENDVPFTSPQIPADPIVPQTMLGQCYPWTPDSYKQVPPPVTYKSLVCGDKPGVPVSPYASLLIYGQCSTGDEWGTRPVYVEKAIVDKKTYILVSAPIEEQLRKARQEFVTPKPEAQKPGTS